MKALTKELPFITGLGNPFTACFSRRTLSSSGCSPGTCRVSETRQFFLIIPFPGRTDQTMLREGCNHPRECGENTWFCLGMQPSLRFIPAHAWNTRKPRGWIRPGSVHPRACGEHTCSISLIFHSIFKEQKSTALFGTNCLHTHLFYAVEDKIGGFVSSPYFKGRPGGVMFSSGKNDTSLIPSISTGILDSLRESGNRNPIPCWCSRP